MRTSKLKLAMWATLAVAVWGLTTTKSEDNVALPIVLLMCVVVLHLLVLSRVPWRVLRSALPAERNAIDRLWDVTLAPWFFAGAVAACALLALIRGGIVVDLGLTLRTLDILQIATAVVVFFAHGYYTFLAFTISVPVDKLK
ncbi:hypothetical protein [Paraburkholderia fungorum]|uniref:hypothetical protein n=1 Tax=Paraburkholderia fungorum TaxID=134537 RepID=UPI00160AF199|nr:hypothetical protein [Paraburkholderia fungorum]MBB5547638.1 hypothetical protein [Paraburkholderia fungorum]